MDSALSEVDRKDVRGIGISGQQHGFVPMDGDGQVACFMACSLMLLLSRYMHVSQLIGPVPMKHPFRICIGHF